MIFNSSINVRLKTLFDKMYLSRNLFEKMKNYILSLESGEYSYTVLMDKANNLINVVENITDNIEGLLEYQTYLSQINDKHNEFNDNFDTILNVIISQYNSVIDLLISDIENTRSLNEISDRNYKSNLTLDVLEYNEPENDNNGKFFIPTDDIYPWNSITKSKNLGTDDIIIYSDDYLTIDPKNENDNLYSGGIKSKKLSRGSTIFDILINTKNSGFAFTSINSKTGEIYSRIEDDYEPEIQVGIDKEIYEIELNLENNGMYTSKPLPGLMLLVKEVEECDISIRRHGEFSSTPTKFFSSIKVK